MTSNDKIGVVIAPKPVCRGCDQMILELEDTRYCIGRFDGKDTERHEYNLHCIHEEICKQWYKEKT